MSTSTTSARPASAMRWAVVAPTFPAPMTVTLLRAMGMSLLRGLMKAVILGRVERAQAGQAPMIRRRRAASREPCAPDPISCSAGGRVGVGVRELLADGGDIGVV